MSEHPFYYSMVVDGQPLHPYQAQILLFTLEIYGNVPRDRIVVQCTERVSNQVLDELARDGYAVSVIAPYLDGKYCNKVAQLDYFAGKEAPHACGVFLLDLDFAVLAPVGVVGRDHVLGKIVDGGNPPLRVLERVFAEAEVGVPGIVPCDWGTDRTVATNFNGGFLYVPWRLVPRMRTAWRKWAEFLHVRPELFEFPSQRDHTDQIAFALALAAQRLPWRHLSANWNFPVHKPDVPQSFRPHAPIRGLHYHQCLDVNGLIDPIFTGSSVIDAAITGVNASIASREESPFFEL